jgi:hypothetical protein
LVSSERDILSLRTSAPLAAFILILSGCGTQPAEVKKAEEPALPESKTGADIDAAAENAKDAEDAMQAAEKAADSDAAKAEGEKSETVKTEAESKAKAEAVEKAKTE